MSEEDLIDLQMHLTAARAAERLRQLADQLEAGGEMTLGANDESVTIPAPTGTVTYELEAEHEGDGYELELELAWRDLPSADD